MQTNANITESIALRIWKDIKQTPPLKQAKRRNYDPQSQLILQEPTLGSYMRSYHTTENLAHARSLISSHTLKFQFENQPEVFRKKVPDRRVDPHVLGTLLQ